MKLPTLSVCQPYATAILLGLKSEEYRDWPTSHRGVLGIHAPAREWPEGYMQFPEVEDGPVPMKALLGVVTVTGCRDLGDGKWAWELADPITFPMPIPMKGKLRIWKAEVDDALLRSCGVQVDADARREPANVVEPLPVVEAGLPEE